MAIRMKEWGMQAYPRQGVHLSLNSVNDWGRTGRVLGQGIESAVGGAVGLASAIHRVQSAGKLADVAGRLEEIGRETTQELMELPVRDWNYSWQQAYAPRVQELLGPLSGEAREQAMRLSEEYGARCSMDAQRQMEINRIRQARQEWQNQVDAAVQRGDAESAGRWLEQGREIFVPEQQMQQQMEKTRSQSLLHHWQQQLQSNPYAAMQAWQSDAGEKPAGEDERRSVETFMAQQKTNLLGQLASQFAAEVAQGNEPDASVLEQATAAGVLRSGQLDSARQQREPLSSADACNWLRRIDERDAGEDDALTVDIALAPIPVQERQLLLQRMLDTAGLPVQQRAGTSRHLWNLYRDGAFGCPGDDEAIRCLGRLQEEALTRQTAGNAREMQQWLDSLRDGDDGWVCFNAQ